MIRFMNAKGELLLQYRERQDSAAITRLIEALHPEAYRRALAVLGDPGAAEDAVQEAYISLVRNAGRFRQGKAFTPWWNAILMSRIRDESRKLRAKARRDRKVGLRRLAEQDGADQEELLDELREQVQELPFPLRAAIALRYFEDKSRREAAEALGISERAIGDRLRKGLTKLRSRLKASRHGLTAPLEALLGRLAVHEVAKPPSAELIIALAARRAASALALTKALGVAALLAIAAITVTKIRAEDPRGSRRSAAREARRAIARPGSGGGAKARDEGQDKGSKPKAASPEEKSEGADNDKASGSAGQKAAAPKSTKPASAGSEAGGETEAEGLAYLLRLVDSAGRPISGAGVRIQADPSPQSNSPPGYGNLRTQRTDGEGRASLPTVKALDPAIYRVFAWHEDLFCLAPIPEPGRRATVVLRSAESPPADCGTLAITLDGWPLYEEPAEVSINLRCERAGVLYSSAFRFHRTLTADRRVYWPELREGRYEVSVSISDGHNISGKFRAEIKAGEVTRLAMPWPAEGITLRGELALPFDGEDRNLYLSLKAKGGGLGFSGRRRGSEYSFENVPPGRYELYARLDGHREQTLEVAVRGTPSRGPALSFLDQGLSIAGEVRNSNPERVWVRAYLVLKGPKGLRREIRMDSDDRRFSFPGLKPGVYQLTIDSQQKPYHSLEKVLRLASDLDLGELVLEESKPPSIQARVVDRQGRPVAGAELVSVWTQRGRSATRSQLLAAPTPWSLYETGADGLRTVSVRFRGSPQRTFRAYAAGFYSDPRSVVLEQGGAKTVTLALRHAKAALDGTVSGAAEGADLYATLKPLSPNTGVRWLQVKVSDEGRFRFDPLPPGCYQLEVGERFQRELDIRSGDQRVEVSLQGAR